MVDVDAVVLNPQPFECLCDGRAMDCQRRAPHRAACVCGGLVCRKCAQAAVSLPDAAPCGLCGRVVGPFDALPPSDPGVLLALASRLEPADGHGAGYVLLRVDPPHASIAETRAHHRVPCCP